VHCDFVWRQELSSAVDDGDTVAIEIARDLRDLFGLAGVLYAACTAPFSPAGPEPITTRSKVSVVDMLSAV
jgi:hypothetical protein